MDKQMKNTTSRKVVLSSKSPRRRELFARLGIPFVIRPSSANERGLEAKSPREFALKAALLKAKTIAKSYEDAVIVAADTVVTIDGDILGKPVDEADAMAILKRLSGKSHEVITAVIVSDLKTGSSLLDTVTTTVWFRELSDEEIEEYIETGDPMDKAGAYGIQTIGDKFVERIDGDYDNVVGLPVKKVRELMAGILGKFGVKPRKLKGS
jgi:septum formation protein